VASRVSGIQWGPNQENVLSLGYPLGSVMPDREPRIGSDYLQGISGVEDAWIQGYDYVVSVEARFLPPTPSLYGAQAPVAVQSPLAGAANVRGFLDWAREKNTFTFYPDVVNTPAFGIPGCYLADPMNLGGMRITPRLDWAQQLKIRNPTYDLGLALTRGLMFEYQPGADISSLGLNAVAYGRTSVASRIGANGVEVMEAANVLRDRHYLQALLTRTTLLEIAQNNQLLQSEAFTTSPWAAPETGGSLTSGQADPFGGTGAWLFTKTGTTTEGRIFQPFTALGAAGTCPISIHIKQGTSASGYFGVYDLTALAWRGQVDWTWTGGVPVLSNGSPAPIANTMRVETLAGGWFRIMGTITGLTVANNNTLYISPVIGTANTGTVYIFGAQAESAYPIATSYTKTTTAVVGRAGDNALQFAWYPLQPMALYLKFLELGSRFAGNGNRLIETRYANGWFSIFATSSVGAGAPYGVTHSDVVLTSLGTTPNLGQLVELLAILRGDGSVELRQSLDSGAETTTGQTGTAPMEVTTPTAFNIGGYTGGPVTMVLPVISVKAIAGGAATTIAQARAA
jgi:hypothetical protein